MNSPVELKITTRDERSITIPNGLNVDGTRKTADFVAKAAVDGYRLKNIAVHQEDRGTQRDPDVVTRAVTLTFEKAA